MHWPTFWLTSLVSAGLALPAANTTDNNIVEHEFTITHKADNSVRAYWTLERINAMQQEPNGDPYAVSSQPPPPDAHLALGAEYTSGGAVTHAVGRLLFTDPDEYGNLTDSSCTATMVESANMATIVTAGHCIKDPNYTNPTNRTMWNYNHLFIPGYRDGIAMTNYTLNRVFLESGWVYGKTLDDVFHHDRAYAVLNPDPNSGKLPGETISQSMKIGFGLNETSYKKVYDFGYPRSINSLGDYRNGTPAFTGRRLAYCNGKAQKWWRSPSILVGEPCVMSGGCSGGPTLIDFDTGLGSGKVVAVNSIVDSSSANATRQILNLYGADVTDDYSRRLFEKAQASRPELQ